MKDASAESVCSRRSKRRDFLAARRPHRHGASLTAGARSPRPQSLPRGLGNHRWTCIAVVGRLGVESVASSSPRSRVGNLLPTRGLLVLPDVALGESRLAVLERSGAAVGGARRTRRSSRFACPHGGWMERVGNQLPTLLAGARSPRPQSLPRFRARTTATRTPNVPVPQFQPFCHSFSCQCGHRNPARDADMLGTLPLASPSHPSSRPMAADSISRARWLPTSGINPTAAFPHAAACA